MKGYHKGVNIRSSADRHFAEGGSVKKDTPKRPASDYTPGANREANKRDGWAPNLPKAARDDIEARFGKHPPKQKEERVVKRGIGGALKKAVKKAAHPLGAAKQVASAATSMVGGKPKGGGMLGRIASKMAPKMAQAGKAAVMPGSSPKMAPAAMAAPVTRPAPAARARSVPSFGRQPMFGRGAPMMKAKGGAACTPATMKRVADKEIARHVAAPAPKGHKGL